MRHPRAAWANQRGARGSADRFALGNNCIRGGFVCSGYPQQKGPWAKPEHKPTQINIESKDPTYVPPGAYGMPQQNYVTPTAAGQQKREPLPYNRGQPSLRIDPPQGRPLHSDDDRPAASTLPSALTASTEHKLSAMSAYTNPANAFPTPVSAAGPGSAFAERPPKDYQRMPPLHDLTRTDSDAQKPTSAPQSRPSTTLPPVVGILPPPRRESPPGVYSQPTPISAHASSTHAASAHPASGVQATAQLALSHTHFAPERSRTEKEEMLKGRAYRPFDKELVLERERCSAACWRFNNSTNPNLGVSPGERARMFQDILHPREGVVVTPGHVTPVTSTGRVGESVAVEAPFNCDYGYNIHMGSNVSIGRNCLVNDVCEVRIGNNVIISPNVCIYTGYCHTHPHMRKGMSGNQYGKKVCIEDDVWIAANAIILPGVTIRKGATIMAGAVVTKVRCVVLLVLASSCSRRFCRELSTDSFLGQDVPSFCIFGGPKASFVRMVNDVGNTARS